MPERPNATGTSLEHSSGHERLRFTGRETLLERITLVQHSDAVSSPSPFDADEFRVSYTGPTAFF
ncbi:MAG: hypothetical protein ABSA91_01255 [Acidimicrobiales bacterium]|jgi:hypothetical protein